jgi:hypothetical protein
MGGRPTGSSLINWSASNDEWELGYDIPIYNPLSVSCPCNECSSKVPKSSRMDAFVKSLTSKLDSSKDR